MDTISLTDNFVLNRQGLNVTHQRYQIKDSAAFFLTRQSSHEETKLVNQFIPVKRQASLHFILNGKTSFTQSSYVPPAIFNGDKCSLMLIQPHETEQLMVAKGNFMMASFFIDLHHFVSLLNTATEALPDKFQKAIYKNVCSCNNYKWSSQAYYVINQIASAEMSTAVSPLFLESKMLELIAILLESEKCDYYTNITISKSDKEKIVAAHDILLSNLATRPTLEQLSRMVGTNEFVLKKGFRECYGKPVYQYVVQKRMEKAMQLLMATNFQVSDIAGLVGYEDTSAFIRTFKKIFKHLPTEIKSKTTSA